MQIPLALLALLLSTVAWADEPTVTLTTTSGETVSVSESQVRKAYQDFMAQGPINQVTKNEDGTSSVVNVRVRVNGVEMPVDPVHSDFSGLYKLKGFGSSAASSAAWVPQSAQQVAVDESGHVFDLSTNDEIVASVVCFPVRR